VETDTLSIPLEPWVSILEKMSAAKLVLFSFPDLTKGPYGQEFIMLHKI
jgi:hypothetical protein